jgi:hypothetical protein
VLIIAFSWGSQLGGHLHTIKQFFWRHCQGERGFLQGSLSLPIFYFVIVLLYFIFACIFLSKIQKKLVPFFDAKKLVPLIVGIPLLLLLVLYIVP